MGARRDQAGDMPDVSDEDGVDLAGDLRESGELDRPRNRRAAAEHELGALFERQCPHVVEVDPAGVATDAAGD
jgi:hypothetical protein